MPHDKTEDATWADKNEDESDPSPPELIKDIAEGVDRLGDIWQFIHNRAMESGQVAGHYYRFKDFLLFGMLANRK